MFSRFFKKQKKSEGGSVIEEFIPQSSTPKLGFSNAPAEWQEIRDSYYKKWFGSDKEPLVWHEVLPVIPHIDIFVFPPSDEKGRNYFTLITSGMSDEKMMLPKGIDKQFARAEIIFYIPNDETQAYQVEKPWYVQAMSFFAHFPFNFKTWLAYSHTIPNGNPPSPVVEGSILTTAIFLPPIFETKEFYDNFMVGNEKVNLLWLSYLTDKETEYKLKYGYDKLAEKFNEDTFPQVFNAFRQSIF